jgi:GT2 family glycosyltransferase
MDLSIIIVNKDTEDLLRDCLLSLSRDRASMHTEVWVVDNASEDESVQMVQTEFPDVGLIANRENVGFASANNQALEKAAGRYCLLLNPDTIVQPGVLDRLCKFMQDTPDAGIAGCAQTYPDGRFQVTCHRDITLWREAIVAFGLAHLLRRLLDYGVRFDSFSGPRLVDWVEGGGLLIRDVALAAVGPMDESFFMYAEDADLCLRVRQAGFQVYYVPDVTVIHYRGQATGLSLRDGGQKRVNTELLVRFHRSKAYYIRKHFGVWQESVYRLLVGIYSLRKLTMGLGLYLLGRIRREEWDQAASAYLALLRTEWNSRNSTHPSRVEQNGGHHRQMQRQ